MAKKIAGPKESQLRQLRESKVADGLFDSDAFENELNALRAKHLSGVRDRITELHAKRREIDEELNKLNSIENKITGHAARTAPASGGKRRRLSDDEKLSAAQIIFDKLHGSKLNRFSSQDLKPFVPEFEPRDLVKFWNEKHKEEKSRSIHQEGVQRATRYFVG